MSRHHSAHAGDVTHILNDIKSMSREEAETVYGIQFLDGDKIYDPTYSQTFNSLGEWADFSVAQDEMEFSQGFGGHDHEDDY